MLSDRMRTRLNEQIALEFESANLYLEMSAWCLAHGLDGCGRFLREHSQEEMGHMLKLFDYVNETGAQAEIRALEPPRHEYESVREIFEATLEHERFITGKISELVDSAFTEKDYSSFNFLQWYVSEQHEEEALFQRVLDLVKLVGSDSKGLFHLDREIGKLRTPGPGAEAAPGA